MNSQRHTIKNYAKTDEKNDSPLTQSLKFIWHILKHHVFKTCLRFGEISFAHTVNEKTLNLVPVTIDCVNNLEGIGQ